MEKAFQRFQALSLFARKIVLYLWSKFGILKPSTNILPLTRLDLGVLETSKQIYWKLQYKVKFFGEFQALPRFPRKMILYSLTKFGILKL